MFCNLDQAHVKVARNDGLSDEAIQERILNLEATSCITKSDEDRFKAGTQFKSFHYQARHRVSDRGLIARFLMLWLKKCIVPHLPKEAITIDIVYKAVLLTHGCSLGLLLAKVCNLLNGLRELHYEFSKGETIVNNKGETIYKTPNLELSYHIHI